MKQVFARSALEAVLGAAERPRTNVFGREAALSEGAPLPARLYLVGLRRSFASPAVVRFVVHPGSRSVPPEVLASLSVIAVIPARYQSTRLPGKALADIAGRPMIEHVFRRAAAARSVSSVIVATDDERVTAAVAAFGGGARMTSAAHPSGTDRLAEVARSLACDLVVNVQGDEPLIEPDMIDQAVAAFVGEPDLVMSTLCCRITDAAEYSDPNVVKVVVDQAGYALYFSRAPIPHHRPGVPAGDLSSGANRGRESFSVSRDPSDKDSRPLFGPSAVAYKHVGLYVYRREFLLRLAALEPTPLERAEGLEQLRPLEHGFRIRTLVTAFEPIGVDTPEDLERVRRIAVTKLRLEPTGRPVSVTKLRY